MFNIMLNSLLKRSPSIRSQILLVTWERVGRISGCRPSICDDAKAGATTRKVAFDAFGRRVALGHLVAQALELIYAVSVFNSTNHGRQIPGLPGSSDPE